MDGTDVQRDRCEAAINLFDQLLLEDDENDELLFLMATAHCNLQSWRMGLEFATQLETVRNEDDWDEEQRLKKALKAHPRVPELLAQMEEVQKLLNDLREGQAAHPEADQEPEQEGTMEEE